MGDNNNQAEINNRRRRVNRIKRGIVYTVLWTIFVLVVLSVVLIVSVYKLSLKAQYLEREIYVLSGTLKTTVEEKDQLKSKAEELEGKITELLEKQETLEETINSIQTEEKPDDQEETKQEAAETVSFSDNNTHETGEPYKVYLTFDDGPSSNTEKILNLLDKHGVKATFFVNGKEEESLLPLYKEITDRGHTIGMHSYSHDYNKVYESVESFETDLLEIRDLIYEQTGVMPVFYRFPGGSSNTVSDIGIAPCIKVLEAYNMVYFDWNVQCGDATIASYTVDTLVNNVMRDVVKYDTSVVLMHDSAARDKTVKALSIILDRLDEMGAEVLPITEETRVIHHE